MIGFRARMFLLIVLFSVASAMGQTSGSGQTPPTTQSTVAAVTQPVDLGHLDGVNYLNDSFGLSLSIPREWVIVSAQQSSQIVDESKKILQAKDQSQQTQIEQSIARSTTLLALTKLPAGQPNNASFMLIAERIPSPQIRNGVDVIRAMENVMKGSNFNIEFQGETRTERISNADFAVATIKNSSPHGVFNQKIYVTVKNGFALQFFFTYLDDADLTPYDAIMKSVKLK